YTRVQTPRFCGFPCSAGALSIFSTGRRPLRTSWLIVGIVLSRSALVSAAHRHATETDLTGKETRGHALQRGPRAAGRGWLLPLRSLAQEWVEHSVWPTGLER